MPFLTALAATPAMADCRLALVLALDISASVDAQEYALQAQGMASALLSPGVAGVILEDPAHPVALSVFVWSGPGDIALVADWTLIDTSNHLVSLADRIAGHARKVSFDGRTAIGAALVQGGFLHATAPPCDRRVIDIAADGENNAGPDPQGPRDALHGITVNALAITGWRPHDQARNDRPQSSLARYLEARVIRGADAFVETALDYADFERAMTRKLLRELKPMLLGALAPRPHAGRIPGRATPRGSMPLATATACGSDGAARGRSPPARGVSHASCHAAACRSPAAGLPGRAHRAFHLTP